MIIHLPNTIPSSQAQALAEQLEALCIEKESHYVLVTSHMGFFTKEAVHAIAEVTLKNADAVQKGLPLENVV